MLSVTVITASDKVTRLPGADVYIIGSTGTVEHVGTTDQFGHIELRHDFASSDSPALGVMVCHPVFYCGILRAEDLNRRQDEKRFQKGTFDMRFYVEVMAEMFNEQDVLNRILAGERVGAFFDDP